MLATSCGPKETAPDNTIDLTSAFESKDIVNFFDILDTAYVVKLETSDKCLIGGIPEYRVFDKYICVSGGNSSSAPAMFFDRKGNFVTSIIKGNGPGEINGYIYTIVDDKNRNRLIIKDYNCLKFFDYDLNYIGKANISNLFFDIAVLGDKYVLRVTIYDKNSDWGEFFDCKMLVTDTNYNVLDGRVHYVIPDGDKMMDRIIGGSYIISEDMLYYHEMQWDSLFVYDTAFHVLPINFPNKAKIDIAEYTIENGNEFWNNIKGNYVARIVPFDNYILFFLNTGQVLYEKSTKKAVKITSAPYMEIYYGNCFVEPLNYMDVKRYKGNNKSKLPELKRVLSESDYAKLESLTEDDNPVLIFYQLKKTLE